MAKKTITECDVERCTKQASRQAECCHDYEEGKPQVKKFDLCEEHYKMWCEKTFRLITKTKVSDYIERSEGEVEEEKEASLRKKTDDELAAKED
jgi:hypothetical protein